MGGTTVVTFESAVPRKRMCFYLELWVVTRCLRSAVVI